jgi:hypothetical protein
METGGARLRAFSVLLCGLFLQDWLSLANRRHEESTTVPLAKLVR